MSRIVPLLRHSPTPTTTATPSNIAHSTRRYSITHQRGGESAARKSCNLDGTHERPVSTRRPRRAFEAFEDTFISSLVAASTCKSHQAIEGLGIRASQQSRHFSTGRFKRQTDVEKSDEHSRITKRDSLRLIDVYLNYDLQGNIKKKTKTHIPLASRLLKNPDQEQAKERKALPGPHHRKVLRPENQEQKKTIIALSKLIPLRLGDVSLEALWSLYQEIHPPRPRYLHNEVLHRFLQHLGFVEYWHEQNAMQRYFQLLDDCVDEGVPLNSHNWTTAISYAGRWMKQATSNEVKGAIQTWMRMEEAGHAADHVTFNVLFDVAVKAGRFALADTIYKEIKVRNLTLDRYLRASLIYYAGMKRDGDGVRRAFQEFVAAGEIVDTTVMNAVIISLLRAGEGAAAEQVLHKMKCLSEDKFGVKNPADWRGRKELRAELNKAAQVLRAEKEMHESSFFGAPFSSEEKHEQVQKLSPIAPDSQTYTILLTYHANNSGDIERIWQLLQEMSEQGLRPHISAYFHILKGFRVHGGYAFTEWNHRRLEGFWKVVLKEMETDFSAGVLQQPEPATNAGPTTPSEPTNPPESATHPAPEPEAQPARQPQAEVEVPVPAHHEESVVQTPKCGDCNNDEALPCDLSDHHSLTPGPTHSATTVPLAGIVRTASPEPVHDAAGALDVLGAMMFEQEATSINKAPVADPEDVVEEELVKPGSLDWGTATTSSFLESVSLQHLTDAALLPEGGTSLEEAGAAEGRPKLRSSTYNQNGSQTSSDDEGLAQQPQAADASSSFLDSLSLRHLTDAALLPEGGTPLEEVNTQGPEDPWLPDMTPRYEPIKPIDEEPKAVLETNTNADDDTFDSQPIWRRNNFQRRDSSGISPSAETTPRIARRNSSVLSGQKPVSLTPGIALEAVRAFYQCCGRDRMLQVWDEISERWYDASEQEISRVANEVGQMVRHASRYEDLERASR